MIVNGWLDWAEHMPAPWSKTNGGTNPAKGIFLHSAEGYTPHLLDLAIGGPLSWHLSNLMDGRLVQHYPFTARCWHAGAGPNQSYIGMEHEGKHDDGEPSLNEAQIINAVRVIQELAAAQRWEPTRTGDATQTLWEHREAPKIGGLASECPDGRIPWPEILRRLEMNGPTLEEVALAFASWLHFVRNGFNLADLSATDKAAIKAAAEKVPA